MNYAKWGFMKPDPRTPHKQGQAHKAEHRAWGNMHHRCRNPKSIGFSDYGGRGIKVCERWKSFAKFFEDMGPKPTPGHSLDRIDNNKGYSKANCRWATRAEQGLNKCNTQRVVFEGVLTTFVELGIRFNMPHSILRRRVVRSKMAIEDAVRIPVQPARRGGPIPKLLPPAL